MEQVAFPRSGGRPIDGLPVFVRADLDLSDLDTTTRQAALLKALGQAQAEQALHELTRDLDAQQAKSVSIGGLLSVQLPEKKKSDRFSERALAILRPWLCAPSIKRFR